MYHELPGVDEFYQVSEEVYGGLLSRPSGQMTRVIFAFSAISVEQHLDKMATHAALSWRERQCTDAEQAWVDVILEGGVPCRLLS